MHQNNRQLTFQFSSNTARLELLHLETTGLHSDTFGKIWLWYDVKHYFGLNSTIMKTPITVCFLLSTLLLFGQVKFENKTVQPALKLKKNESYFVSILHSKIKFDKGKQSSGGSLDYKAIITVIDSTEDELTFKWVYQTPKESTANPEAVALMKLIAGLELVYTTDGTGGFKELVNWEAV